MSSLPNALLRCAKQFIGIMVTLALLTSLAPAAELVMPDGAEIIGQWGTGKYNGVHASGNIACCAALGAGIDIVDISDPDNPVLLANFDTSGESQGVFIADNLVYIADGYSGLQIVDISQPSAPVLLGYLDTPNNAVQVQVVNNKAYVVDQTGLHIIDVSNPETPTLLGSYDTPGYTRDVFVSGTTAYVADDEHGLQIIDVKNSGKPQLLGNFDSPGDAYGIWVKGTVAYIADGPKGLQIVDVSNPAQPQLLSSKGTPFTSRVQVVGNIAYVNNNNSGLKVFDITNPKVPTLLTGGVPGLFDADNAHGGFNDVFVTGTFAYMACGSAGLRVADVSNPATPPVIRGFYNHYSGFAADVQVVGNTAYLAAELSGLQIIDVSNPTAPQRLGRFYEYAKSVQVIGTTAYIGGAKKFHIVDVSNPASPVELGRCTISDYAKDLHVVNGMAFVALEFNGLEILSVSDPSAPEIIVTYEMPGYSSKGVYVNNNLVYVTDTDKLEIVDIQRISGNDPHIIGSYETPGSATDVQVVGSTAYVADDYKGLQIINITTPTTPTLISNYPTQGWAVGVQIIGNRAYLLNQTGEIGSLQVLDITDPSQPEYIKSCDTTARPQEFHVVGDLAYIADGSSGRLLIIDLEGNQADIYFPHAACADGWQTEIALINPGSGETQGRLVAYDNQGQPVADPFSVFLAPWERTEYTIADYFNYDDKIKIGYLVFETGSHNIVGYTKFYHQQSGYRVALPAVTGANDNTLYISHIASDNNWWTGMALLNTTNNALNPLMTFSDGSQKTISLAAGEHKSFSLRDLFAAPQPQIGSAIITNCSGIIGLELFGSIGAGHQLSGISLSKKLANVIYYPHIATGDNWWSGLVAYDPQGANQNFSITPYSETGTAFTPITVDLNIGQKKYFNSAAGIGLPDDAVWLRIDAASEITGFELFGSMDGNQLGGYTGVRISSTSGVLAKLDQNGWSGIALVNSEAKAASVTLKARNDQGKLLASNTFILAAFARIMGTPEDLFPTADISSATYLSYQSDNKLVGFQLNGDGLFLDALPALSR